MCGLIETKEYRKGWFTMLPCVSSTLVLDLQPAHSTKPGQLANGVAHKPKKGAAQGTHLSIWIF